MKRLIGLRVAGLTYVMLPEGFVYLACLLDVYSRNCIGWSLSRQMDAQLPLQALEMALAQRQITAGLIHHSDRGRQYCSNVYVERLLDVGACISMSTPGQPTENAFAESLFKTVKWEEVYLHQYRTFEEVQACLQTFLEDVYHAKCLHSSLDDVPPEEFELKYVRCERFSGLDFLGALQTIRLSNRLSSALLCVERRAVRKGGRLVESGTDAEAHAKISGNWKWGLWESTIVSTDAPVEPFDEFVLFVGLRLRLLSPAGQAVS